MKLISKKQISGLIPIFKEPARVLSREQYNEEIKSSNIPVYLKPENINKTFRINGVYYRAVIKNNQIHVQSWTDEKDDPHNEYPNAGIQQKGGLRWRKNGNVIEYEDGETSVYQDKDGNFLTPDEFFKRNRGIGDEGYSILSDGTNIKYNDSTGGWETVQNKTSTKTTKTTKTNKSTKKNKSTNMADYTIKKGDTLSKIAKANKVTVQELAEWNKDTVSDINKIYAGKTLRLSDPTKNQNTSQSQNNQPSVNQNQSTTTQLQLRINQLLTLNSITDL